MDHVHTSNLLVLLYKAVKSILYFHKGDQTQVSTVYKYYGEVKGALASLAPIFRACCATHSPGERCAPRVSVIHAVRHRVCRSPYVRYLPYGITPLYHPVG